MTRQEITKSCMEERTRLMEKYTGCLSENPSRDDIFRLAEQMEDAYRVFLESLWQQIKADDTRTLDQLLDKRYNRMAMTLAYSRSISEADEKAKEITFWEQITDSNGRDIAHLNTLVRSYFTDLLAHITMDFMEDIIKVIIQDHDRL